MMTTLSSFLRRGRHTLHTLSLDPRFHRAIKLILSALCGFLLSAASLSHSPQPLVLGLVLWASGWQALLVSLGAMGGYLLFWGAHGLQGVIWMLLGLAAALGPGQGQTVRQMPLMKPAIAGLIVAVTGLAFQLWQIDDIRLSLYLLRIAMGAGAAWLFPAAEKKEPFALWLTGATVVLALAQTAPLPWLNPGFLAAGALAVSGAFPAAALAGLALDLAQVTGVPMTAVLCLTYLLRLLPWANTALVRLAPGIMHLLVCALTGTWDLNPIPTLALGGLLGHFLPAQPKISHRRGRPGWHRSVLRWRQRCWPRRSGFCWRCRSCLLTRKR